MEISIYIFNDNQESLDGIVQVENIAKETVKGRAIFNQVETGKHRVRALVFGYRGSTETIEVTQNNQKFNLIVKSG